MASYRYDPWIGADYKSGAARLLVVGESHYGDDGEDERGLTNAVVEKWQSGEKKLRYFTKLALLLTGKPVADLDRATDLNGIAFTNYVQKLLPWDNKGSPNRTALHEAQAPFLEIVQELDPTHILVTGHRAYKHMPEALDERDELVGGAKRHVCEYETPSGKARTMALPHLSRTPVAKWVPVVQDFRTLPAIASKQ